MRRVRRERAALLAAAATAAALIASCRSAGPARPPLPARLPGPRLAESPGMGPALRIGILTDAKRVTVAAEAEVVVWGSSGNQEPKQTRIMRATFVPVRANVAQSPRFRVQVASLRDEAAARAAANRAREIAGQDPLVRWSPETKTYQVRLGDFPNREEAVGLASRLAQSGVVQPFVVADQPPSLPGQVRFAETGELLVAATIVPSVDREALVVDTIAYRGLIEVRPNDSGTLTVVNIVNTEDYLRGVVPNELSPQSFPEIEALKAQAVAARTYALRNRGQSVSQGFDICATPSCQVYRGQASEDPLSDRAVAETRGMVALFNESLINALYTSTCGGHTEDASNVFEGNQGAAYLKGVVCIPERSAWTTIQAPAPRASWGDVPGLSRDAALLAALGVLRGGEEGPTARETLSETEARDWVARLRSAIARQGCPAPVEKPLNRRGTFFHYLVDSLCWGERQQRLLAPQDAEYLLQIEDRSQLRGDEERMAAALFLHEGILVPFPDNTLRPDTAMTRAQAIELLAHVVEKAGAADLVSAEFRSAMVGELTVKKGDALAAYPLDAGVRLFRALDRDHIAASEVTLLAGDKVAFVLRDGRVVFLEAEQNRLGAAADRTSRYYRWEVRLSPDEVGRAIAKYGNVGTVRDVIPGRLGVSGRVVELTVSGSNGVVTLTGLRIRVALGLRENLFVIERETDAAGRVRRFVFTGKGWGHGVGLCQVGAFGMAVAGADFETILKHYYQGIRLVRAY